MGALRKIAVVSLLSVAVVAVVLVAGCAERPAEKPAQPQQQTEQPPAPEQAAPPAAQEKPAQQPPERLFSKTPKLTLHATRAGQAGTRGMNNVVLAISPDSTHWAAVVQAESGKFYVASDEGNGREYDLIESALFFSPDSKRLAYTARKGKGLILVVDGAGTPVDGSARGIFFSPDSQHYAYTLSSGRGMSVVRDNVPDKEYANISRMMYSPDSRRFAYSASKDGRTEFAVLDGVEEKQYDKIAWMSFSPDSKHSAYVALWEGAWHVVLDGKEFKGYESITAAEFCPDMTVAYLAGRTGAETLVINETELPQYRALPVFSPDGKRSVNVALESGKKCAVIDNKPDANKYDDILAITFSPDSKRVAYPASTGGKWLCVLDGAEGQTYDGIFAGSPRFSPDSKHFAYIAQRGNDRFIVLDGVEGKAYISIIWPQRVQAGPANIERPFFFFSPDSRHIAYSAQGDAGYIFVVDGSEVAAAVQPWGDMLFDEPGKIHTIAVIEREIYNVEITYTEESVPAPNP